MTGRKRRPPSLREYKHAPSVPTVTVPAHMLEMLWSPSTPEQSLAGELWMLGEFIDDCARKGLETEAAALRKRQRRLERALAESQIASATVEALHIGRAVVSIIRDSAFSRAVDSHRRSTRYLRNKQSVTDTQIRAAVEKYPRQKDAAAALGIEPRMLRNHEKRLGLKKRKSVRLPPRKK